jgi:hypothetical protein
MFFYLRVLRYYQTWSTSTLKIVLYSYSVLKTSIPSCTVQEKIFIYVMTLGSRLTGRGVADATVKQ